MGQSSAHYVKHLQSDHNAPSARRRMRDVELTQRSPASAAGNRFSAEGLTAAYVPIDHKDGFSYQWIGHAHYLALHDLHLSDGETFSDNSTANRRRDLRDLLTFVPARCRVWGWSIPRSVGQSFTAFYLDPRQFEQEMAQKIRQAPEQPLLYFGNPALRTTLRKMQAALSAPLPLEAMFIESLCLVAMLELCVTQRENLGAAGRFPGRLAVSSERLICEYVDANLHKEIGLSELAQLVGLSRFHFLRVFKQTTRETPYQYLLRCRIKRAEELLKRHAGSIADIARAVGFKDATRFIRAFRRINGITPGTYRE